MVAEVTLDDRLRATNFRPAGFDYLRLSLALSIILWHTIEVCFGSATDLYWYSGWTRPFPGMLIPMFFSLSGFLVAGSMERSKALPTFLGLRALRILPALAGEVLLSALVLGPIFTTLPLKAYVSDPLFGSYFLNILGEPHYYLPGVFAHTPMVGRVNPQLWTIPFELMCYVALATLAVCGVFSRRILLLAAFGALQLLLAYIALTRHRDAIGAVTGLTMIGCFLTGLLLYRYRDRVLWHPGLGILSLLIALPLFLIPNGERFCLLPVAYFTVWLGLFNPVRNRLLISGDYSYGIYLYGCPIQQALVASAPIFAVWYVNMAVALPCTFGVAAFSWWCIEKPTLRLRRHLVALEGRYIVWREAIFAKLRRILLVGQRQREFAMGEGISGYLPAVDGLRAVAALSVVLFHEGDLPYGWAGVWVFFVLSGFVITRGMIGSGWTLSAANYKGFMLRRTARIWPLYCLYIIVTLLLLPFSDNGFAGGWLELLGLGTFTYNFVGMSLQPTHTLDHLWTISVEQQFYTVYPFLFAFAIRSSKSAVLGSALVAFFAIRVAASLWFLNSGMELERAGRAIYAFSIGHFDAFMVGALAAFYPAQLARIRFPLLALAVTMLLAAFTYTLKTIDYAAMPVHSVRAVIEATRPTLGVHPYEHGAMIWCYVLLVLIAVALLAQAIGPAGIVQRILSWRPLVWVGKVSFGVYMWQGVVAPLFFNTVGVPPHTASLAVRLVAMPAYIALLVGVASASYLWFEQRFHHRIGIGAAAPKVLSSSG